MIRKINGKRVRILSDGVQTRFIIPTGNTIINDVIISANELKSPDTLTLRSAVLKSGTTNTLTMRLYWNTTVSTVGATQLGLYGIAASTRYVQFYRRIFFSDNSTGIMMNTGFNATNDMGDYGTTISTVSISNWLSTTGYFFITIDGVGGATDEVSGVYLSLEI